MTRTVHIVAALAAALAYGACSNTVYDASGVPRVGPLVCPAPGTHACEALDVCARDDDAERCGPGCQPCATDVPGARAICVANTCGYECPAGRLKCETGCCEAAAIVAGGDHACAVTRGTAELLCWGANNDGQLGIGDTSGQDQPTPAKVPLPGRVIAASAGTAHGCAVVEGGETWCWGRASSFDSGAEYVYAPQRVELMSGARAVAAGGGHSCAILAGGAVRCAGAWNPSGIPFPGDLPISAATPETSIGAGNDFSCALAGGDVMCWGANNRGELGATEVTQQPAKVPLPGLATTFDLGWEHGCAQPADGGFVHCWGAPRGSTTALAGPQPMSAVSHPALAIAAGEAHTCTVAEGGDVQCWGETAAHVVIGGTPEAPGTPVTVGVRAVALDAGLNHTCAIDAGQDVVCWGRGARGQLGDGARADSTGPVRIVSR